MSESDRELLELAAKAHGNCKYFNDAWRCAETGYREFNPLNEDGDALRLAVKLKIDIEFHHENTHEGEVVTATKNSNIHSICCFENTAMNSSLLSATRRAIVRAAAEIGKS